MAKVLIPNARFKGQKNVDWRKVNVGQDDDTDTELKNTPRDVKEMLGFDPKHSERKMPSIRAKMRAIAAYDFDAAAAANAKVDAFRKDLQKNHMKREWLSSNTVWDYIETVNGKATVQVNPVYPTGKLPTVELFWLLAMNRGAGRGALKLLCDLADKHGVYMQLDAIPLNNKQDGKDFKLSSSQLVTFYKSFGFKVKPNRQSKYTFMIRKPKGT